MTSPAAEEPWIPGYQPGLVLEDLDPYAEPAWPGEAAYPAYAVAPPVASRSTAGMAIASFVLGILGLVCAGVLAAVPAVILGHLARRRIRTTGQGGGAFALAGLILGYISIGLTALVVALDLFFVAVLAVAISAAGG